MTSKIANIAFLLLYVLSTAAMAQTDKDNKDATKSGAVKLGKYVQMSGSWFVAYQDKSKHTFATEATPALHDHSTAFVLKRSYITLKSKLNDVFSVRFTQDITIDKEGNDAGNVETRLKYLYLKMKPQLKSRWLTGLWIEVGMVHTPWVDFEQKINTYRVQDNMFSVRNGLFSSADFGVTIGGNIGPKMDKDFLKNVSKAMPGRYCSFALGVYNGGGYSALEKNNNKVIEGRVSWRPLAWALPQMQISAYANYGKGNTEHNPDFVQYLGMLSYTSQRITFTAQGGTGFGDRKGKYVQADAKDIALSNRGYSVFAEYKWQKLPLALWARYDHFEVSDATAIATDRYIGGLAYRINPWVRLVLDTEYDSNISNDHFIYEANLEIVF